MFVMILKNAAVGMPTFELLAKHSQEDCKVDGARSLLHHLIELIIANIETT